MIPAGYMLKTVMAKPPSIKKDSVIDIFAVSPCLSENFADYIDYWRHNGFWLFNRPSDMDEIVSREGKNRDDFKLFYLNI
ncbi:MAG: hypothetical protein HZB38_14300 [Planctomycetes bacterium]|nr:hypothetical protein [Planctomycetota bacterium]